MRIRTIRPEFYTSEHVGELDWETRYVFMCLWSYVQDNGVGLDSARLIRGQCMPYDEESSVYDIEQALGALDGFGFIKRYERDGKKLLWIPTFCKYQKISNPGACPLKPPENQGSDKSDSFSQTSTDPNSSSQTLTDTHSVCKELPESVRKTQWSSSRSRSNSYISSPPISPPQKNTEPQPLVDVPAEPEPQKRRRRSKTSLPDGWKPNAKHERRAREVGTDLAIEATKFANWAVANGKTYADWDRAFDNWLLNCRKYDGPSKTDGRSPSRSQMNLAANMAKTWEYMTDEERARFTGGGLNAVQG